MSGAEHPRTPEPAGGAPAADRVLPCAKCLRRSWLIARLAAHIEVVWSTRRGTLRGVALLSLSDEALIAGLAGADAGRIAAEYRRFDAASARAACAASGVVALCRCDPRHPAALADLPDPPAVLYVHGDLDRVEAAGPRDCVAIVGARRASGYGLARAHELGRGIAAAGLTVVSGMALGADAAAHAGALDAGGTTIAVLAGGPERAYPRSKRDLHAAIARSGAVVSELPPGTGVRRWCFPARNRIIAALARATVVVEAGARSGSLITAGLAVDLGREVAAVPGQVTSPLAAGTNALIAEGAQLVRGAEDVLELLFDLPASAVTRAAAVPPEPLEPELQRLLDRVGAGCDTVSALAADGVAVDAALAGLAQLELRGRVRRGAGGRYLPTR